MAKTKKKTVWLIAAVIFLVTAQVAVVGFVITQVFAQNAPRPQGANPGQRQKPQTFSPPLGEPGRGPSSRQATPPSVKKAVAKPTGPRAEPPQFSKGGGVYTNSMTVELKAKSAKAVIHYTLDGSDPGEKSPVYSAPIKVEQTTLLRAVCLEPGLAPSLSVSHAYSRLADDLLGFSSNLPLVVIDTFNSPISTQDYYPVSARFIKLTGGRATLTGPADYDGRTDVKRRGYSSLRFPKASLTLKMRDDDGEKVKSSLYGLPAESDWVLYAPYSDKTLMRDVLAYELGNQTGHYAPRTQLVEVFIHRSGGPLSYRDYVGVYVLVEKIKRGKERVNIAKLRPEDNAEPDISGGYILKRDHGANNGGGRGGRGFSAPRASNDGVGFITPQGLHLFHVEPDEDELTAAQKKWITGYMASFERALYGEKFKSPTEGYAKYLDVEAFIDFFLLVEMSKNIDGLRYSAYLHKPRGGKITLGPAWDWNLSFGNADVYDASDPRGWYHENLRTTEIAWIYRLREDPDFMQRVADRWAELRRGVMVPEKILGRVDALRTQLQESQVRNNQKWRVIGRELQGNDYVGPTYDAEVNWMKVWIKDRITWIDRQFPAAPVLSVKPGNVAQGSKVTLSAESGEVFYTLDGTDPRASGGAKAAQAQPYKASLAVERDTKITARLRRGGLWSAPVTATYTVDGTVRPAAKP